LQTYITQIHITQIYVIQIHVTQIINKQNRPYAMPAAFSFHVEVQLSLTNQLPDAKFLRSSSVSHKNSHFMEPIGSLPHS